LPGERLTNSDKRALLVWVMLGIVGALFARHYFFRAFPEASVDFRVSRDEALACAAICERPRRGRQQLQVSHYF